MNKLGTSQARLSAFHTGAHFKAARRRRRRQQQPLTRSARCRPRGICTGYRIRNGGLSPEMRFLVMPKHSKKTQNKSRIFVSDGCRQTAPVSLERNQRERPRLPGFDASFSCLFQPVPSSFFSLLLETLCQYKTRHVLESTNRQEPLAARCPQHDAASCDARIWQRRREEFANSPIVWSND